MTQDIHERARHLIAAAQVEGISAADQTWLDSHLEDCAACAQDAAETRRTLQTLRWMAVNADPGMVRATRLQVRMRARELDEGRSRSLLLWASGVLTTVVGMVTLPLLWSGFAWLGQKMSLPNGVWQFGFLVAWLLPAVVIAAMLRQQSREARQSGDVLRSRGMK
jgi:anti-sigma factor RsiW